MFYSGGAKKKQNIRNILKKKEEEESDATAESVAETDPDPDADTDADSDPDADTDADTNSEPSLDSNEMSDDPENEKCIATIGTNDIRNHHYGFVNNDLAYDVEEFAESHPHIKEYKLIVYQINTSIAKPFLEFLFYYDAREKIPKCQLPHYRHHAKHHIRKETDNIMNTLFTRKFRYKGFFHFTVGEDRHNDTCFIFYEARYVKQPPYHHYIGKSDVAHDHWHWVTTPEIIYQHTYVTIPIDPDVVDLFCAYPTIGILQSVEHPSRDIINIELPTILYYGSDISYTENTAIYGLKREPIISRYGPFYYFTTLKHSFYWACYHFPRRQKQHSGSTGAANATTREARKTVNGGISRYAVFTNRMKTVFIDDDYDVDDVKKYVDRKNIFETKINEYRHTVEVYTPGTYDSFYSHGYDWTEQYDTIYNGMYAIDKRLMPVWCVKDHQHFTLLSYYEVKTGDGASYPAHYDVNFTGYTIL